MLLYRPSFITVIPFIFTLCVAVSAAPQYGRPMFHTMDVDPDKSVVDNSSTTAMSAEPAVASVSAQSAEIVGAPAAADSGNYSGKAINGVRPSRDTGRMKMCISLGVAATLVYSVL